MAYTIENAKIAVVDDAESLIERGLFFAKMPDEEIDDAETPETLVSVFLSDGLDEADEMSSDDAEAFLDEAEGILMAELRSHFPTYFN